MHIGSQPYVIGQIPSVMIGIRIDHDIVGIPNPTGAIVVIIGGHAEEVRPGPEVVPCTAAQSVYMAAADFAGEAAVFPWTVHMIMRIAGAGVADPLIVLGVDVRRVWMSRLVAIIRALVVPPSVIAAAAGLAGLRRRGLSLGGGAVRRNMSMADRGPLRRVLRLRMLGLRALRLRMLRLCVLRRVRGLPVVVRFCLLSG